MLPLTSDELVHLSPCDLFCTDAAHQPGCSELDRFISELGELLADIAQNASVPA